MHPGECKLGNMSCFKCGQLGHFLKDCPKQNIVQNKQNDRDGRLNFMQATLEGPPIFQGRLEAPPNIQTPPPPQDRIYAYTNADALASTSNVVTGQLLLVRYDVFVLFDSDATHYFIFLELARKSCDIIEKTIKFLGWP